jgi:hypothetical protein
MLSPITASILILASLVPLSLLVDTRPPFGTSVSSTRTVAIRSGV